jgi:hypothetical protein
MLASQVAIIRFCWWVFEMTDLRPDLVTPPAGWLLLDAERTAMEPARAAQRAVVEETVREMTLSGVPLADPEWVGSQAVVAELLLLAADDGFDFPWDQPASELAAVLRSRPFRT